MRLKILGSSSSGNCALLQTDDCKVLIDAGFSGRRTCRMLEECNESIDQIDAIFLTHEHSDHSCGVRGLTAKTTIKVFANRDTAQAVQQGLKRRPNWQVFETGSTFRFRDLEITSFSLPHDAYDPVGFVFKNGGNGSSRPQRSIGWMTDLGYVPDTVHDYVRHTSVLVLESNHDTKLLDDCEHRPWPLKQRIKGRHGHLSNQSACDFLGKVEEPAWEQVFLAHLSKDCNAVSLVEETLDSGCSHESRFPVTVIDPEHHAHPDYEWQSQ